MNRGGIGRTARKPPTKAARVGLSIVALLMLGVGIAYIATHASETLRRTGWIGQHGRLTVVGCDTERGSRGGVSYHCFGEFAADEVTNSTAAMTQAYLDDTSTSRYHIGTVLKVSSNGHGTVSPIGFGYVLRALAALLFVGVAVGGIGVLVAGAVVARPEGRWQRVSAVVLKTGIGMVIGGGGLALLLGLLSLL